MSALRPRVGLACNRATRDAKVARTDLRRLERFADFEFAAFDEPSSWDAPPPHNPAAEDRLAAFAAGLAGLVVCHGAPRVTARVLDAAPRLEVVGELEGDRFAHRIDLQAAATRGVRAIDTTHGSSYGVAEWALALMLIGLRNAGALFRRLSAHEGVFTEPGERHADPGYDRGELSGKRVGLIGCGHAGRRLLELLAPFDVDVLVHDPYMAREIADVYDVTATTLELAMALADVVVCVVPLTPTTRGMIGRDELTLLRPDAVFVNVSRGAVVSSPALEERLRQGDVIACLDVFDPEPIPPDSAVRDLPNVFLSPHIAGVTRQAQTRFFSLMVDELERCFAGHETRHDLTADALAVRLGSPAPARTHHRLEGRHDG